MRVELAEEVLQSFLAMELECRTSPLGNLATLHAAWVDTSQAEAAVCILFSQQGREVSGLRLADMTSLVTEERMDDVEHFAAEVHAYGYWEPLGSNWEYVRPDPAGVYWLGTPPYPAAPISTDAADQ